MYEYLEELDEMNWSARGNVLNQYLRKTSIGTTVKNKQKLIFCRFECRMRRFEFWQGVWSHRRSLDRVKMPFSMYHSFSYPEPFLRAVNGARRGALAKSISNWHLIGYNEGYCSNNVYIFYHVFMVSGFGFGQSPSSHRA